jgi:hypothetical protein
MINQTSFSIGRRILWGQELDEAVAAAVAQGALSLRHAYMAIFTFVSREEKIKRQCRGLYDLMKRKKERRKERKYYRRTYIFWCGKLMHLATPVVIDHRNFYPSTSRGSR